jgi:hypothetical protein
MAQCSHSGLQLGDTEVTDRAGTNRLTNTPEHLAFAKDAITARVRHIDNAHL